ncbi:heat-stable enterotoxin A, partial [Striga asiatica]
MDLNNWVIKEIRPSLYESNFTQQFPFSFAILLINFGDYRQNTNKPKQPLTLSTGEVNVNAGSFGSAADGTRVKRGLADGTEAHVPARQEQHTRFLPAAAPAHSAAALAVVAAAGGARFVGLPAVSVSRLSDGLLQIGSQGVCRRLVRLSQVPPYLILGAHGFDSFLQRLVQFSDLLDFVLLGSKPLGEALHRRRRDPPRVPPEISSPRKLKPPYDESRVLTASRDRFLEAGTQVRPLSDFISAGAFIGSAVAIDEPYIETTLSIPAAAVAATVFDAEATTPYTDGAPNTFPLPST